MLRHVVDGTPSILDPGMRQKRVRLHSHAVMRRDPPATKTPVEHERTLETLCAPRIQSRCHRDRVLKTLNLDRVRVRAEVVHLGTSADPAPGPLESPNAKRQPHDHTPDHPTP